MIFPKYNLSEEVENFKYSTLIVLKIVSNIKLPKQVSLLTEKNYNVSSAGFKNRNNRDPVLPILPDYSI